MIGKEIKPGDKLQAGDGESVSVVWTSRVARTGSQKRQEAEQLRQAMGQHDMWDPSDLDGQSQHEGQHALGTRKPTQHLIVDHRGKLIPATISTKPLSDKEIIKMALAPDDPQMDDRLLAYRARKKSGRQGITRDQF